MRKPYISTYSYFTENKPPASSKRPFVVLIASSDLSMPIHVRPFRVADCNVEPEPQKQSKTMLSLSEDVVIIISINSIFF